jgi:TetR/AcrR family transcriptional repressor of bet genes
VTPTLILHYFDDKDRVIEAVYRDLYSRLARDTLDRLHQAKTPRARLTAVLEAQVSPGMVSKDVVTAWFALSAIATDKPSLKRMERINAARLVSNLVHALRQLGFDGPDARHHRQPE